MKTVIRSSTVPLLVLAALSFIFIHSAAATSFQLSGRVTDQASAPISGAAVDVIDPATSSIVASSVTDPSGNYTVMVAEGTYNVRVAPPAGSGFGIAVALNQSISSDRSLDFVLVPLGVVSLGGRVLDGMGIGAPGQLVNLSPVAGGSSSSSQTDGSGNYSIQAAAGDYRLSVNGSNSSPAVAVPHFYNLESTSSISLTGSTTVDIALPVKRVDVHVQDAQGAAAPDVAVSANNMFSPNLMIASLAANGFSVGGFPDTTDAAGNTTLWLFPSTGTDKYIITARPPSGSASALTSLFNIDITSDTSLTITLPDAVTLTGRVLDGLGNGAPGQVVNVIPAAGGSSAFSQTDGSGHYSVQVAAGDYRLSVNGSTPSPPAAIPHFYNLESTSSISLTQDTALDISLPVKRVDVRVQDSQGGPVPDVAVTTNNMFSPNLMLASLAANGFSVGGFPDTTDASGNTTLWVFPSSGSDKYIITATPPPGGPFATVNVQNVDVLADKSIIIVLQFVHAPPATTAMLSPSPDAGGLFPDPVTVTLTSTAAAGFSVAASYYRVDGAPTQTYAGPFTVSGAGPHTVEYWSVDNAGVFEAPNTLAFTIRSTQLTALGPASIWLGLKNSDDVGTKFDLLAEVFKNGSPIGSGQLNGISGGSSGFNNAVLRTINLALSSPVSFSAGDTLSIKLSVRIAVGVSGHRSGTARLWFNDAAANSRFNATIGGVASSYYLLDGFALGTASGTGPKKTVDVLVDRAVGGNPFKPFGTWSKSF